MSSSKRKSVGLPNASGIYAIENAINGKRYYGSAVNLRMRKSQHWTLLSLNKHYNQHLQRAWNKYGEDSFSFVVIELVEKEFLLSSEQKYIDLNSGGYNISPTANSRLGVKVSEESRQRMSLSRIGKKRSIESRLKQSESMRGKPKAWRPSQETRDIWSRQRTGRKASAETRLALSASLRKRWACSQDRGPVFLNCAFCDSVFSVPYTQRKRVKSCSKECAFSLISKNKKGKPYVRKNKIDSRSMIVEFFGRTGTLGEFVKEAGAVSYFTARSRIVNLGWGVEKAIMTPARKITS